jgi:hypothetical protein
LRIPGHLGAVVSPAATAINDTATATTANVGKEMQGIVMMKLTSEQAES